MLLILFFLLTLTSGCQVCNYGSGTYSCGATIWQGGSEGCLFQCCEGSWTKCALIGNSWVCYDRCNKAFVHDQNITSIIGNPKYTADNRLYTQHVVTTVYDETTHSFLMGQVLNSSQVKLGDYILWPGSDLNITMPKSVVMRIDHYQVTKDRSNCCASISIGWPPSCHVKACCGEGCCC